MVFAFGFFFTLMVLIKHLAESVKTKRLPPGPRKLPLIGNLHQLGGLPHQSFQRLSKQHGPLMFLKLGSIPTLVVSSADMAREIFSNHDLVFSGRAVLYAARRLSYNRSTVSFAPYGEYWREMRKIMLQELLSSRRVRSFQTVRNDEVNLLLDSVTRSCSSGPVNLRELTLLLSNNIVCRVVFGRSFTAGATKFSTILGETEALLGGFCTADFFPWMGWLNKFNGLDAKLEKNFRALDKFYEEAIDERLDPNRQTIENEEDIIDALLRVQKDYTRALAITRDHIKAVLTDIFIAGSDTSSVTLEWAMTELISNPNAIKKAQDEVRQVARGREKIEEDDLSKLVYLEAVVKETFRLHPPAPLLVPRETTESCTVDGFEIPTKTRVFVNVRCIGRDPKIWENPDKFQPERFLESSVDYRGLHFELLPFGAGRRGCPGINFAVPIVELALANLVYRFNWTLPPGMKLEDLEMEEVFGLTVHRKDPLCLQAHPVM